MAAVSVWWSPAAAALALREMWSHFSTGPGRPVPFSREVSYRRYGILMCVHPSARHPFLHRGEPLAFGSMHGLIPASLTSVTASLLSFAGRSAAG